MNSYFEIILKKSLIIAFLIFLIPFYSSAEAGKGISDESIILALLALVIIIANQIYLIITSIKKIMNPKVNSSILHYISLIIGVIIMAIYIPNKGYNSPFLFEIFITVPFLLGVVSLSISIYNWVIKKKK